MYQKKVQIKFLVISVVFLSLINKSDAYFFELSTTSKMKIRQGFYRLYHENPAEDSTTTEKGVSIVALTSTDTKHFYLPQYTPAATPISNKEEVRKSIIEKLLNIIQSQFEVESSQINIFTPENATTSTSSDYQYEN